MLSVSVVIPSYNRCTLLPRALDSVLAQTRPADEIIVVDDGSRDETRALLQRDYPQVRLIRQANTGVSAARNCGIRAASGEWIALLDSDDAWLPQKLALQLRALDRHPMYRLVHGDEIWIRDGVRVNPMNKHKKQGGHIFLQCLPLCCISPSAVLIQRHLFDEVGYFDETLPACEDYDLWLRICARAPVLYIDQLLLKKYGGHPDQLSRRHWGMDRFRVRALEKILATDTLAPGDRMAARATLLQKAIILAKGAHKHGRDRLATRYQNLIEHHRLSIANLQCPHHPHR